MSKRLFEDTDERTEKVLIELIRNAPDWKKFQQIDSLTNACRQMAISGIKSRYPEAGDDEVRKRLAALIFAREEVIKAYNWDPDKEGY